MDKQNTPIYTIEPHGNAYALYHGRDSQHHGLNLARISEVDSKRPELLQLIASALNAYTAAQAPAAPSAYLNAAGVRASDKPITVVRKLDAAFHDAVTFKDATPALPATEDSLAGEQAEVQAEPVADDYPHEQMDALALARYKVVPSDQSMYWRHAVVAGDGQQHLYNGSEVDCQNMARKFAGAFLDGAFAFHERRTAPQAQPSDALDAETTKKAARYDWLRSGNDYQSDGPMVVLYESEGDRGDRPYWSIASDALDASIDAAMAAAQEGGNASAGKDGAA